MRYGVYYNPETDSLVVFEKTDTGCMLHGHDVPGIVEAWLTGKYIFIGEEQ